MSFVLPGEHFADRAQLPYGGDKWSVTLWLHHDRLDGENLKLLTNGSLRYSWEEFKFGVGTLNNSVTR